jgi:hypothetical protein
VGTGTASHPCPTPQVSRSRPLQLPPLPATSPCAHLFSPPAGPGAGAAVAAAAAGEGAEEGEGGALGPGGAGAGGGAGPTDAAEHGGGGGGAGGAGGGRGAPRPPVAMAALRGYALLGMPGGLAVFNVSNVIKYGAQVKRSHRITVESLTRATRALTARR